MIRVALTLEKTGERGGAELLALKLARHLRDVGFACRIVELPRFRILEPAVQHALKSKWRVLRFALFVADMFLGYWSIRLTGLREYDVVVTLQPSCLYLRHPNMLICFLHHDRAAYDLYEYLGAMRRGIDFRGFTLTMRLRRILDLGTIAYIRKRRLRLIAQSNNVARRLAVFWGMRPNRVIYPGGYEPSFYSAPGEYVLYVGKFDWTVKRLWMVYEAARRLPDLKFVVAGSGMPPQEATPANLVLIVNFTDREKADIYARASCVLFPAYDEDFGLVPVEAMSAGKPCVVCSDGGGATETVVNGKTGLVVEPTVQCLADGIRKLTQVGQSMREDCIRRARLFSWDVSLREIEKEIRTLLGELNVSR
jgi:glycosyltransferase involved in cell wall biosynthesis